MNKKQVGITSAVSALLATLFLAFGLTGGVELMGSYSVTQENEYSTVLTINVPSQFSPDICVLKLNDMEVGKTLLPDNKFKTFPAVTSDVSRLSVEFYYRGEKAGVGLFDENGVLAIKAKEGLVNETEDK